MVKNENKFDIVCRYCAKKDESDLQITVTDNSGTLFGFKTSIISFLFDFSKQKAEIYSNIAWRFVFYVSFLNVTKV